VGELRRDPLTDEWVNIVGHRQGRPNLPADGCPFCVGGLEAPEAYDTRWFPNRWPAFDAAQVVLYSPRHDASLATLGVAQVRKVVDLWAERTAALLARPDVEYVLVFESRGEEVGATIHHPHGQIYGLPFVPPSPAREAEVARSSGGDPVAIEIEAEVADGRRIVFDGGDWVAYVPYASGYPYGVRAAPRTPIGRLDELDERGRDGLAELLVDVLGRYDRLWRDEPGVSQIFPYLMWFHQAPAGRLDPDDGEYHLHLHLAPPQRAPGVARFVAAGELGSGTFSNPIVPEAAAATLRSV
jgi:UDPglucose--hexose-1-phosphate uridylyltransferase